MSRLKDGETLCLNDAIVKSQDYYTLQKRVISDSDKINATPDITIEKLGQLWVIDASNGTSSKEIKSKINFYKNSFPSAVVVVFSSGVANIEMMSYTDSKFKLSTI
eukprot:gene31573-42100_t